MIFPTLNIFRASKTCTGPQYPAARTLRKRPSPRRSRKSGPRICQLFTSKSRDSKARRAAWKPPGRSPATSTSRGALRPGPSATSPTPVPLVLHLSPATLLFFATYFTLIAARGGGGSTSKKRVDELPSRRGTTLRPTAKKKVLDI